MEEFSKKLLKEFLYNSWRDSRRTPGWISVELVKDSLLRKSWRNIQRSSRRNWYRTSGGIFKWISGRIYKETHGGIFIVVLNNFPKYFWRNSRRTVEEILEWTPGEISKELLERMSEFQNDFWTNSRRAPGRIHDELLSRRNYGSNSQRIFWKNSQMNSWTNIWRNSWSNSRSSFWRNFLWNLHRIPAGIPEELLKGFMIELLEEFPK